MINSSTALEQIPFLEKLYQAALTKEPRRLLTRQFVSSVDVKEVVDQLTKEMSELHLRYSSLLVYGVARIHLRQTELLASDVSHLLKMALSGRLRVKQLNSMSVDPRRITRPVSQTLGQIQLPGGSGSALLDLAGLDPAMLGVQPDMRELMRALESQQLPATLYDSELQSTMPSSSLFFSSSSASLSSIYGPRITDPRSSTEEALHANEGSAQGEQLTSLGTDTTGTGEDKAPDVPLARLEFNDGFTADYNPDDYRDVGPLVVPPGVPVAGRVLDIAAAAAAVADRAPGEPDAAPARVMRPPRHLSMNGAVDDAASLQIPADEYKQMLDGRYVRTVDRQLLPRHGELGYLGRELLGVDNSAAAYGEHMLMTTPPALCRRHKARFGELMGGLFSHTQQRREIRVPQPAAEPMLEMPEDTELDLGLSTHSEAEGAVPLDDIFADASSEHSAPTLSIEGGVLQSPSIHLDAQVPQMQNPSRLLRASSAQLAQQLPELLARSHLLNYKCSPVLQRLAGGPTTTPSPHLPAALWLAFHQMRTDAPVSLTEHFKQDGLTRQLCAEVYLSVLHLCHEGLVTLGSPRYGDVSAEMRAPN